MSKEIPGRYENRIQKKQEFNLRVLYFLDMYGLVGQPPQWIWPGDRYLYELAHLNARLVGRGFKSIHPHDWVTYLEEAPKGVLKKRKQIKFLQEDGFLLELKPGD